MKFRLATPALMLAAGLLCATSHAAEDPQRYLLANLPLMIANARNYVVGTHLVKFDTATGRMWRYERKSRSDSHFVPIPQEGAPAADAKSVGRFRLVSREGGKAELPDLLVLDTATGATWEYRSESQSRDGAEILLERLLQVKEREPR